MKVPSKHLLYIGYYVNAVLFEDITSKGINNMSAASRNLEEALLREFSKVDEPMVKAITYVPDSPAITVPAYSEIDGFPVQHIPILRKSILSWIKATFRFWKFLQREVHNGSTVLMYAVNPIFMLPLIIAKRTKKLTLVTICSEVPSFRRYKKTLAKRLKKNIQTFFNNRFDKYILLAENMKDVVKVGNKPFLVMEGVASNLPAQPQTSHRRNVVMYAGGLHADNNLMLLINACEKSTRVEECWICGAGPQEKEIAEIASNSKKIKFLGRKTHDEVLKLEKQVKILVNLRNPSDKLTEYSFPSKILEYLASGAQVVSTRLKGIPSEYFDYVSALDNLDTDELSHLLDNLITMPDDTFQAKAINALDFLKREKSAKAQSQKILDFICQ